MVFAATMTFLLLIAGALVTSNRAGLSVPDWPTSFGSLYRIPPMVGGVKYEHSHRMLAELVGLLTIVAAVWIWKAEPRRWMRWLGIVALLGVIIQGVLGGLTVRMFLPWYISTAHAAIAQTFFCLLVCMALFTSRAWIAEPPVPVLDQRRPGLYTLCLISLAFLYLQLVFGAAFRHGGMSFAYHLINAVLVTAVLIWTSVRAMAESHRVPALGFSARMVHGLLMLQLALGFAAYLTRVRWGKDAPQPLPSMIASTVAHVAVGALLLSFTFVLTIQTRRHLAAAPVLDQPAGSRDEVRA
jgi:heme a synthase